VTPAKYLAWRFGGTRLRGRFALAESILVEGVEEVRS